ncbi:MAG TPA: (Fe-S)-binding protein, partial [Ktedonobacterales bacterium]|nr:(Fe-S)-binding protein [Ktedonobacterales bacterium]
MVHPIISPAGGFVGSLVFAAVLFFAWATFGWRVTQLVRAIQAGQRENRLDHMGERIQYWLLMVLGQRGVLRDPLPGIAHFFTFWGFIILQLDALELWANGLNLRLPLLDSRAYAVLVDSVIVLVLLGLTEFAYRRVILRPAALRSQSHGQLDGLIILGMIFLVILTLAAYEIFAYRATKGALWTPFGTLFAGATAGMPAGGALALTSVCWWANVLVVLSFLIYIPFSKHLHLLATPFNVFFRSFAPKGALTPIKDLEEREDYGVHKVTQFTWKQLLDGYACTECGRCNSVCPALATDKPLWPKEIILGVREELFAYAGGPAAVGDTASPSQVAQKKMVGDVIQEESLWACTNCGACVEICPVSIEHVQKIDDMRRYLVMEESSFPQEVTPLFNNLERNQNPWEISNDTRAEWAQAIGVKTLAEDPDVEVLYWVGCMGSFDARNRKVATAFARVMQAAGVRFGILGPEESCTGDPARRIGNEYLYQMLAQQNVEVLNTYGFGKGSAAGANGAKGASGATNGQAPAAGNGPGNGHGVGADPNRSYNVKTVVATCPHCFNTIKNEYPQLGGNFEVVHHTQFIDGLISSGQLKLPEGFDQRTLTYHDPCFIGRWNDVYDEPRRVLSVINSNGVSEMRRNRNRSFCCGGGGGRVWMEERIGKRINNTRVQEALDTGAEGLAAA